MSSQLKMPHIPLSHRQQINSDPRFKKCARLDEGDCKGRITIEEVFLYAGKQIKEMWNYIPLCSYHHGVENYANCAGQNKKRHQEIAMAQATPEDRKKYPRIKWN